MSLVQNRPRYMLLHAYFLEGTDRAFISKKSIVYGWLHSCCCFSCGWLFATPWTAAHQTPLSMGFSRQETCNGLPCPPPGNLRDLGIQPALLMSSALEGGFFTTSATVRSVMEKRTRRGELGLMTWRGAFSILLICWWIWIGLNLGKNTPPFSQALL